VDAYQEETLEDESSRTVLKLHPTLAPYKAAILPLTKKLSEEARSLFAELAKKFMIDYDESGSIGKRYRRQDEIGTPFCITYDFDTLQDQSVTIRDRDTMKQERVKIEKLEQYIREKIEF
jgi:glycyl-tRNA synthetase